MTWNYRIIKSTHKSGGKRFHRFAVYEVYYDDDGSIMTATANPECLEWEDTNQREALKDLKWTIKAIAADIEKYPVLSMSDIPGCDEEECQDTRRNR